MLDRSITQDHSTMEDRNTANDEERGSDFEGVIRTETMPKQENGKSDGEISLRMAQVQVSTLREMPKQTEPNEYVENSSEGVLSFQLYISKYLNLLSYRGKDFLAVYFILIPTFGDPLLANKQIPSLVRIIVTKIYFIKTISETSDRWQLIYFYSTRLQT